MTYLLLPALSSVQIIIDPVSTDDHPATAHSVLTVNNVMVVTH